MKKPIEIWNGTDVELYKAKWDIEKAAEKIMNKYEEKVNNAIQKDILDAIEYHFKDQISFRIVNNTLIVKLNVNETYVFSHKIPLNKIHKNGDTYYPPVRSNKIKKWRGD